MVDENVNSFDANPRGVLLDDYAIICGYPPMDEFLSFMRDRSSGKRPEYRLLADQWRKGNQYVKTLEESTPEKQNYRFLPLPEHLSDLQQEVLADPVVQGTYDRVPIDVGMIELDKLCVYQKHLNLSYVRSLQTILSKDANEETIFRFCLLDPPKPTVKFAKVAANGYVFVSPSNDLRFLGPALLDPEQVTDYPLPGRAAGVVGLVAGMGANCLSVISFDGRLILHNGTHRAAALWQAGFRQVPAIVQEVASLDELDALFSSRTYYRIKPFLEMKRPPMFKDYFDDKLTASVKVPRRLTQIKITFGWENIEVPLV